MLCPWGRWHAQTEALRSVLARSYPVITCVCSAPIVAPTFPNRKQEQRLDNLAMLDHPHHALWPRSSGQWDPQSQDDPGHMNSLSSRVPTVGFKDAGNCGWPQPWDHLYGQSSHTEPLHPSLTSDPYAEALGAGLLSAESHSTSEPNLGNAGR